jgi:hypothetical protein
MNKGACTTKILNNRQYLLYSDDKIKPCPSFDYWLKNIMLCGG